MPPSTLPGMPAKTSVCSKSSVSQMGELIETALATFDHSETRIFVSHMSPGKEGLLAQLALALRASVRSRWMDAKFD